MKIKFVKMVASGNDFVLIDNRRLRFRKGMGALARKLCDRRMAVGADGLLILEPSRNANFRMRIFNPDGSEPRMCGNGIRCAAMFAIQAKIAPSSMRIETGAGIVKARVGRGRVRVRLTDPERIRLNRRLRLHRKGDSPQKGTVPFSQSSVTVHLIDTGVPHAVVFVRDLARVNVQKEGALLRYHGAFKPAGTNVDFVQLKGKRRIAVRTYERGVEGETLACGTGVTASAVASSLARGLVPPIQVETRSGDVLKVSFDRDGKDVQNVSLEGGARRVFRGDLELIGG